MNRKERKNHWENIYDSKQLDEVSWYQPKPKTSLDLIISCKPAREANIIDIGGGDSFLVDNLIEQGFSNISVLDISKKAIERAQKRLSNLSKKVNWIASDITDFETNFQFDIWHDRAAFHFLTEEKDIAKYISIAEKSIAPSGNLIIGTFSKKGPTKCSGIEIKQYSPYELEETFSRGFQLIESKIIEHSTPFDTVQEFVFCVLERN